jgi:hypothetical protein
MYCYKGTYRCAIHKNSSKNTLVFIRIPDLEGRVRIRSKGTVTGYANIGTVRDHTGGSMKLNACILILAHMVYL